MNDKFDPTKIHRGGMILGAPTGLTARLAAPTFMFTPDDGTGDGTPAPEGTTPETVTDGGAAPETTDSTVTDDASAQYLPEGYDTLDDQALRDHFNTLDAEVVAAQTIAPDAPVEEMQTRVAEARARRGAQGTIAGLLQARADARAAATAEMAELGGAAPTLPTAPLSEAPAARAAAAGAAQPVSPTTGAPAAAPATAATLVRERETQAPVGVTDAPLSRLAAVAAVSSRWKSQEESTVGQAASFRSMVNDTMPSRPATESEHIGVLKPAILAAARVTDSNPERMLTDSPSHNERILGEAMEQHRQARADAGLAEDPQGLARMASAANGVTGFLSEFRPRMAAICDPPTIFREATTCGTDATPFQNALVPMEATSGNALKFQYRLPTSMSEAAAGIGEWDTTKQAAIDRTDPDTWKPCVSIACPGYDTQTAKEITACYEIDAFTELSSPEAEADFVFAKDRAFARFTEGWHLRKTDEFLRYVSFNGFVGAVPDVIEAVLTAIASGDYGERLEPGTYTVFGSPGLLYALAIDENKRAFRNGNSTGLADVQQIVQDATGTSYVQLFDRELAADGSLKASPFGSFGSVGAGSATVMPKIGTTGFTLRIVDTSSLVRFVTGEAQFGQGITHDQARQNKRGFFQRIFGGQMKPGCAPGWKVDITLCPDGSRGGFVLPGCDPTGYKADGSGQFEATPRG